MEIKDDDVVVDGCQGRERHISDLSLLSLVTENRVRERVRQDIERELVLVRILPSPLPRGMRRCSASFVDPMENVFVHVVGVPLQLKALPRFRSGYRHRGSEACARVLAREALGVARHLMCVDFGDHMTVARTGALLADLGGRVDVTYFPKRSDVPDVVSVLVENPYPGVRGVDASRPDPLLDAYRAAVKEADSHTACQLAKAFIHFKYGWSFSEDCSYGSEVPATPEEPTLAPQGL